MNHKPIMKVRQRWFSTSQQWRQNFAMRGQEHCPNVTDAGGMQSAEKPHVFRLNAQGKEKTKGYLCAGLHQPYLPAQVLLGLQHRAGSPRSWLPLLCSAAATSPPPQNEPESCF